MKPKPKKSSKPVPKPKPKSKTFDDILKSVSKPKRFQKILQVT